jgi:hypothetical protein
VHLLWLQVSNGMLITDNNPATFWVTHPNNTLIGNVAAGQPNHMHVGICYQLQAVISTLYSRTAPAAV